MTYMGIDTCSRSYETVRENSVDLANLELSNPFPQTQLKTIEFSINHKNKITSKLDKAQKTLGLSRGALAVFLTLLLGASIPLMFFDFVLGAILASFLLLGIRYLENK